MKEYFLDNETCYRINEFKLDRVTLVFIHGLTGSSSSWLPYEKVFENKYNILTYDIRGHGLSKKYPNYEDYEIKNFALDLHKLTLHLNIPKFILVGHSLGTLIVAEYAKLYKEDVLGLIFLAPIFGTEKDFVGKTSRLILKLTKIFSWLPTFSPKPGRHVDYAEFMSTTDWDPKRMYIDIRNTTLRVHLYCLRQSMILPQEYSLEKIKVPTLIFHGKNDTMSLVKNSIALSNTIQNSELVIFPNADHFALFSNFTEVVEIIESFIEKNKSSLVL